MGMSERARKMDTGSARVVTVDTRVRRVVRTNVHVGWFTDMVTCVCRVADMDTRIGRIVDIRTRVRRVADIGTRIGRGLDTNNRRVTRMDTDIRPVAGMDTHIARVAQMDTSIARVDTDIRRVTRMDTYTDIRRVTRMDTVIARFARTGAVSSRGGAEVHTERAQVLRAYSDSGMFRRYDTIVPLHTEVRIDIALAFRVGVTIADVPCVLYSRNVNAVLNRDTVTVRIKLPRALATAQGCGGTLVGAWNAFLLHRIVHIAIYEIDTCSYDSFARCGVCYSLVFVVNIFDMRFIRRAHGICQEPEI